MDSLFKCDTEVLGESLGVAPHVWSHLGAVGASVERNGTVANIGRLLKAAKAKGMTVAISPHYYYPTDHGWRFGGPLEKLMHAIGMFDRKGPLTTEGFEGSGADFMPEYKAYIEDGKTIIASPHKVYGPDQVSLRRRDLSDGRSRRKVDFARLINDRNQRVILEEGVIRENECPDAGDGRLQRVPNRRFRSPGRTALSGGQGATRALRPRCATSLAALCRSSRARPWKREIRER